MGDKKSPAFQNKLCIIEPFLQPHDEKVGKGGCSVFLTSNHANFKLGCNGPFSMYYVTMAASCPRDLRGQLKLLQEVAIFKGIADTAFCCDGHRLFTSCKWHPENAIAETMTVDEVQKVSLRHISEFEENSEEYYQMVKIIFNNIQVLMGQERIGRAFFLDSNREASNSVPGPTFLKNNNFKILGGFSTTITRGTNEDNTVSTLLHIQRINCVVNEKSIYDIYDKNQSKMLIGRDVITKYNNKIYRISDLKEIDIEEEMELNDKKISYANYFRQRYDITLKHARQPFVISKMNRLAIQRKENLEYKPEAPKEKDKSLSIPGELCFLRDFSDSERSDISRNKTFDSVLVRQPREHLKDIGNFCSWTKEGESAAHFMKKWDLKIEEEPIKIAGRELDVVEVFSNGKIINGKMAYGWKFDEVRFDVPWNAKHRFGILVIDRDANQFNPFIADVKMEMNRLEIDCAIETVICKVADIEQCLKNFKHLALVFIENDDVYARVKKFTISEGLLTQCVTVKKGMHKDYRHRKVVAKSCVKQMLCKLGYIPWGVKISIAPTMVVGLVTAITTAKHIQASVFSISSNFSQYLSFVNYFKDKDEYNKNLKQNFLSAIDEFTKSKAWPARFIIYRGGVRDSHLSSIKEYETDVVLQIIKTVYEDQEYMPQIIYIIVKNSNSVKFLKRGDNPNPGTIVDKTVVKPNFYEFYMISQRITRGLSTPAHFNVLMDTGFFDKKRAIRSPIPAGLLQHITYALTHLSFNGEGTTRMPAPVHYAHRLADLVKKVYRGDSLSPINDTIKLKLFYL